MRLAESSWNNSQNDVRDSCKSYVKNNRRIKKTKMFLGLGRKSRMKSRMCLFKDHYVWNYWEPFGRWDIEDQQRNTTPVSPPTTTHEGLREQPLAPSLPRLVSCGQFRANGATRFNEYGRTCGKMQSALTPALSQREREEKKTIETFCRSLFAGSSELEIDYVCDQKLYEA